MVEYNENVRKDKMYKRITEIGLRFSVQENVGETDMPASQHTGIKHIYIFYIYHIIYYLSTQDIQTLAMLQETIGAYDILKEHRNYNCNLY